MNLYDAAYLSAMPVIAPALAWRRWRKGKYRESLPAMLGYRLPAPPLGNPKSHRCWLHSVSVGETIGAGAVYREFRKLKSDWEFLGTTTTETGQAQARASLPAVEHLTYAPADFSWTVCAFHEAWKPSVYVFFETEIWPNGLLECARRGLPVFLANGDLSAESARNYARLSMVFRRPLQAVTRFFVQTQKDAEAYARLLGRGGEARIEVTGNVKFDALPAPLSPGEREELRAAWGAVGDSPVIVAGSTHEGEEETILRAFGEVRRHHDQALLVLVPRHPERFESVAETVQRLGFRLHRTSRGANPARVPQAQVVLMDEMRVLARRYGGGDIALVGGSWVPIGGHNLLEPAAHSLPVLRGPHMHEQPEIVRLLGPDNGAPCVEAPQLANAIANLITDRDKRVALGKKAAEAANANRGAAARTASRIVEEVERVKSVL
jgi:3-deoxy-D-manno-octulosonic-acid transferase